MCGSFPNLLANKHKMDSMHKVEVVNLQITTGGKTLHGSLQSFKL